MVCIGFICKFCNVHLRGCSASAAVVLSHTALAEQQQQSNLGSIVSSSPVTPTTPTSSSIEHTSSSPSFHLQDKEQRKCRSVGLCVHVQLPPRQETNARNDDYDDSM